MADTLAVESSMLAQVTRRQHGLVTAMQLQGIGLSAPAIRRRVAAGKLVQVGFHVFAIAGAPSTWEQSAYAACLDRGEGAVLSHLSAARAWRLDAPEGGPIHVTVPYGRSHRAGNRTTVVHRSRWCGTRERTLVGLLPVTTVERTIVDLGSMLRPTCLSRVVDDALGRRLVMPDQLLAAIERSARRRQAGTRTLRSVVEPWAGERGVDSPAEARFLRALAAAGVPRPEVQRAVDDEDGRVGRVDFMWPEHMLVLEVDGFRWHANPKAHAADSVRGNRLVAAGATLLRATPTEIDSNSGPVLAAVLRHLGPTAR
jgi:hypothetical protein